MKKNLDETLEDFADTLTKSYPATFIFKTLFWFALRNLKELEEVETEVDTCMVKITWVNCPNPFMKRGRKRKRRNYA